MGKPLGKWPLEIQRITARRMIDIIRNAKVAGSRLGTYLIAGLGLAVLRTTMLISDSIDTVVICHV